MKAVKWIAIAVITLAGIALLMRGSGPRSAGAPVAEHAAPPEAVDAVANDLAVADRADSAISPVAADSYQVVLSSLGQKCTESRDSLAGLVRSQIAPLEAGERRELSLYVFLSMLDEAVPAGQSAISCAKVVQVMMIGTKIGR